MIRTQRTSLALGLAMTLALAACSGNPAPSGTTEVGAIQGDITYAFWGNPQRGEKVEAIIDLFETAHPGTNVTGDLADYNSYIERMSVRAAGGDLACAVGTQTTFFATYAESNVLLPLDDLIANGQIDVSDIPEETLAAGKVNGTQYMIPTGTFARVLGYNNGLLEQAGVQPPNSDMTWQDYAAWLRELSQELPSGVYAAEIEAGNMFSFTSWVIGHGKQMFTEAGELGFDRELVKEWFELWIGLTEDGATVPTAMLPEQSAAVELAPLALGKAAAGTKDIPHLYITDQALQGAGLPAGVGWASIPSQEKNRSANVLGSNGISIAANCDNVGTAAAWIDFFANDKDAALTFRSDNGILTNTVGQEALLADPDTPDGVKQNVTVFRELVAAGDLTTTQYPAGLRTMTTELLRLYQQAAFGESTVDAAVDEFMANSQEAVS